MAGYGLGGQMITKMVLHLSCPRDAGRDGRMFAVKCPTHEHRKVVKMTKDLYDSDGNVAGRRIQSRHFRCLFIRK